MALGPPLQSVFVCAALLSLTAVRAEPQQFVMVNARWDEALFQRIATDFAPAPTSGVALGIGAIFSYLHVPLDKVEADLKRFLACAEKHNVPVVVQLDSEQWWGGRPDLWNWWDPQRPGYNPANRANVEWSGWSPDQALRLAWRNWGRQLRVLPPPNLLSPAYRDACHQAQARLVPVLLAWQQALPAERRWLLVGVKLGWESSIGVGAYFYPDGNALADKPAKDDPVRPHKIEELPGRGFQPLGYAAVTTAGLATSGALTEAHLAEVTRRHLEDLCRQAAELGLPRERLFTHAGGWKEGELVYGAALNRYACPGWSFYRYASDPTRDKTAQRELARSDAPYFGAVEWFYGGPRQTDGWLKALRATLAAPRLRYLCIYNWESIVASEPVLVALRASVGATGQAPTVTGK